MVARSFPRVTCRVENKGFSRAGSAGEEGQLLRRDEFLDCPHLFWSGGNASVLRESHLNGLVWHVEGFLSSKPVRGRKKLGFHA